jgi:hypothetical protein
MVNVKARTIHNAKIKEQAVQVQVVLPLLLSLVEGLEINCGHGLSLASIASFGLICRKITVLQCFKI